MMLAQQALGEASAMQERVCELSEMSSRSEWSQLLEHSRWLSDEYPQHRALRRMQLEALLELGHYADAEALCEQQLQVIPSPRPQPKAPAQSLEAEPGRDAEA
jgi:hypothetical protein